MRSSTTISARSSNGSTHGSSTYGRSVDPAQARRLLDADQRVRHGLPAEAEAIVGNPYVLAERYLAPKGEEPIGFVTVDHALHPHESMPAPPGLIVGNRDARRARALLTEVL